MIPSQQGLLDSFYSLYFPFFPLTLYNVIENLDQVARKTTDVYCMMMNDLERKARVLLY